MKYEIHLQQVDNYYLKEIDEALPAIDINNENHIGALKNITEQIMEQYKYFPGNDVIVNNSVSISLKDYQVSTLFNLIIFENKSYNQINYAPGHIYTIYCILLEALNSFTQEHFRLEREEIIEDDTKGLFNFMLTAPQKEILVEMLYNKYWINKTSCYDRETIYYLHRYLSSPCEDIKNEN